ncbi:hypothetical protein, conserved [Eimeria maxima]|uniref:Transmembrane protein n=1 Tax=Eimeria maxima TaxID=5804 RepID=U6MCQ5_EIMMA|nr:hypothetical protein, conserved [Eimeria maxima]CDJ59445.1 hypothetical protein, conserved [Eimeria maxima]
MESQTHSAMAIRPYVEQLGASFLTATNAAASKLSSHRGRRLWSRSRRYVLPASLASVVAVVMLIFLCNAIQKKNHALHSRARQISASDRPNGLHEGVCGNESDVGTGEMNSQASHVVAFLSEPSIQGTAASRREPPASVGSPEEHPQAAFAQLPPNIPVLGRTDAAPWDLTAFSPAQLQLDATPRGLTAFSPAHLQLVSVDLTPTEPVVPSRTGATPFLLVSFIPAEPHLASPNTTPIGFPVPVRAVPPWSSVSHSPAQPSVLSSNVTTASAGPSGAAAVPSLRVPRRPPGWMTGQRSRELHAAEALLQLSMSRPSLEPKSVESERQAEDRAQPSTSTQSQETLQMQSPVALTAKHKRWVSPFGRFIAPPRAGDPSISSHLFCHLPEVDSSKRLRPLNPVAALCEGFSRRKLALLLERARDFLARPTLTPAELEGITHVSEQLCSCIAHDETSLDDLPIRPLTEHLGLQFLALDVIVATLQLLGQPPEGPWWEKVISSVPQYIPSISAPVYNLRVKTHYTKFLAQELMDALQILKTGKRPSDSTLVWLKRMLFCSEYSPRRFRAPFYDDWRRDEARFARLNQQPTEEHVDGRSLR